MGGEFVRFLMVGGAKTALTYGIYLILLYFINPYWAYIASFVASIYPSYLLNVKFTFRSEHSSGKLVSYPLVLVAQLLVGLAALHISLQAGTSDKLAPLFSVAIAAPMGFLMTRWVVGKGKENRNPVLFLAIFAFAVSIAAVYGALINGNLFPHGLLFNSDFASTFLMWQDVRTGIFSYADWNFQQVSTPYLFTDFPVIWALFWLTGGSLAAGIHFFGVLMIFLNTLAWVLVSDCIFEKSPLRRAVAFLLFALGGVVLAYGADDLLGDSFFPIAHFSTWVVAGFGVLLFLSAIRSRRAVFSISLFILCLAGVASDPVLIVWFIAPAVAAGFLWAVLFRIVSPVFPSVAAVAGFLCSPLLRGHFIETGKTTLQFSGFGNPEHIAAAFKDMGTWGAETAERHPLLATIWVLFFSLVVIEIFRGFRSVRSGKNTEPKRMFVLLFLLFASAASVVAAILSGNFFIEISSGTVLSGRYFLPARIVPLFIGWAFLSTVVRTAPSARTLAVAAVVLMAVCAPHVLSLKGRGDALTNYYPPLAQCFDDGARKFGLKKGIAAYWWAKSIMATSKTGVQIAQVSSYPNPARREQVWAWRYGTPDRVFQGPFDFVIANGGKYRPDQDWCEGYGPERCRAFSSTRDPMMSYILNPLYAMRHFDREMYPAFQCGGSQILVFALPPGIRPSGN